MSAFLFWINIVFAGCGMPSPLPVCICVVAHDPDDPADVREWSDSDVIFVGNALDVQQPDADGPSRRVRFAVEASWRGERTDTVTLFVGANAACASYTAGGRYLVLANARGEPGEPLTTGPCHLAWRLSYDRTREMLLELGPPSWTPTADGSRPIDGAVRIGERPASGARTAHVGLGGMDGTQIRRIEIADQSRDGGSSVPAFELAEGLYQLRVHWIDGGITNTYILVRCEHEFGDGSCRSFRYLADLREPLPAAIGR